MFCKEHPSARWKAGVPGGVSAGLGSSIGIFLARTLPENSNYRLVVFVVVTLVVGCIGAFISAQVSLGGMRPYYRRFIEEHKDKLSQPA
jgi:uncharacterized membrane protein YfcA